MKRSILVAAALALAALLCLMLFPRLRADAPGEARERASVSETEPEAEKTALFPALEESEVSSLQVRSGERSFRFRRRNGRVSVNGNAADAEAFQLLLEQIVSLPVQPAEQSVPDGDPMLSLQMTTDDAEIDVAFYAASEMAYVVCDSLSPAVCLTDAWRLGTMLVACDGTRILDEQGMETPSE